MGWESASVKMRPEKINHHVLFLNLCPWWNEHTLMSKTWRVGKCPVYALSLKEGERVSSPVESVKASAA
jgi:hypothetical protein